MFKDELWAQFGPTDEDDFDKTLTYTTKQFSSGLSMRIRKNGAIGHKGGYKKLMRKEPTNTCTLTQRKTKDKIKFVDPL